MKQRNGLIVCTFFAGLLGCAPFDYTASDHPIARTSVEPAPIAPRVALVLGSGGPRGYAHLGVMNVLEEAGIEYDLVVGSSVGAFIGAFWADGLSATELSALAATGGPLTVFDPSPFADRGWIRGQKLQDYVNNRLDAGAIEALQRRLIVVATRRDDKSPVFFTEGNVGVAVRASSAMPGIISPVGINGVVYEDADESLPVAVRAARQAGARFVIAVDVSARAGAAPPGTSEKIILRDRQRRERIEPEVAAADFLIHPDLDYRAGPRRSYFAMAHQAGRKEARSVLPELLERLQQAGISALGYQPRPIPPG
ncbi:MAG: hypothetical protein EA417_12830 [Gammaproteobacteria bacterium]|nr:MAG: hypothetical protein EA417_12830 [Gammaproteobacteria bacterium]